MMEWGIRLIVGFQPLMVISPTASWKQIVHNSRLFHMWMIASQSISEDQSLWQTVNGQTISICFTYT